MTAQVRRLGAVSNPASLNVQVPLYTVPAGKVAIIRSIFQGTDNTPTVDAAMGVAMYAAGFGGVGFLWNQKVSQNDSRIWPLSTVMQAGDYLTVQHSEAGQYTMVQGVELDAGDAPTLWKLTVVNVPATTTFVYTVPAGKRLRVKEAVICNHADAVNWAVSVSGIGYVVLIRTTPRVGNVFGLDLTLNAGEILTASADPTVGHLFMSGLLEDA